MRPAPTIGHPAVIRNINKSLVLNTIREQGPSTRTQLAKRTRLGWGSICKHVDELLGAGMITELPADTSTGGRPATPLAIDPGYGFFLGATLGSYATRIMAVDFGGRILHREEHRTNADDSQERLLTTFADRLRAAAAAGTSGKLLGVGVGCAGEVDAERGMVLRACNLKELSEAPVAQMLRDALRVPALVTNKLTSMTLGEMVAGAGKGGDDFILVALGNGLSSGIVSRGRFMWPYPYRGIGDIGHMTMDKNGPRCRCGLSGCLEALAGGWALAERFAALGSGLRLEELTPEMVSADARLREIVREAGAWIGRAVTTMIQAYWPQKVILTGRLLQLGPRLLEGIKAEIAARVHAGRFDVAALVISPLGRWSGPLGAIQHVWNMLYHQRIVYV